MQILRIILLVYFIIGISYEIFLILQGRFNIWSVPVNIIGGPVVITHFALKYLVKKYKGPANIRHKDLLKGKKAALFDLDGTIWDSDPIWVEAIRKTAVNNGLGEIEILPTYMPGTELTKTWKVLRSYNKFKLPRKKSIKDLCAETEKNVIDYIKSAQQLPIIDGFDDISFFLKIEKELKLGLVTNSGKEIVDAFLERSGMGELFDIVLTGKDVAQKKPSPAIFLKAARKLKVSPKNVLVFEDSLSGSKAAAKATMDQIIILRTETPEVEYFGNIYGFFPDFLGLDKMIAIPAKERMLEGLKQYRESLGIPEQEPEGNQELQAQETTNPQM